MIKEAVGRIDQLFLAGWREMEFFNSNNANMNKESMDAPEQRYHTNTATKPQNWDTFYF